jgi:spermidine/putrescine transport system permease protein
MSRRTGSIAIGAGVALAFALMYLPLLAVAAFSFNAARYGTTWTGATVGWYARLADDSGVLSAARTSLILASPSTAVATALGTMLALGLARTPWPRRWRVALEGLVHLPVVTPDVLFAACLVVAFAALRALAGAAGAPEGTFDPGWTQLLIGHVAFQVSFVALVVLARLRAIGPEQEEAARDLYADGWVFVRRVLLPQLAPGIAAGAILAFTLSLDDFIVSFFTAGTTTQTLPLQIYASVRRGLSPEIDALSTLVFGASVVLVLAFAILSRPRPDPRTHP